MCGYFASRGRRMLKVESEIVKVYEFRELSGERVVQGTALGQVGSTLSEMMWLGSLSSKESKTNQSSG
jgi:hypothetical protein